MKFCSRCGSEYQDHVKECADCGGTELISADEMKKRGLGLPDELDQRRFVVAGVAEDPLTSERFFQVLQGAQIPTILRARRGGTLDNLTTPAMPWWEILVPEEFLTQASELIRQERTRAETDAEEAERAAVLEEAEQEASGSEPPANR